MTAKQADRIADESCDDASERIARQAEAEALEARFAARRAANARLNLNDRDSTDILRELRETLAR